MANNYAVYRVTRCCNSGETGFFSVDGTLPGLTPPTPGQGVFLYGAASDITLTDANGNVVIFESGECYTIETTTQGTGFTFVVDLLASDFTTVSDCQDVRCGTPCGTDPKKLVFTPCCDQYPTLEFQGTDWQDYIGVIIPLTSSKVPSNQFQQNNSGFSNITYNSLLFGNCYEVTVVDITQAEFDSLDPIAPYVEGTNFTQVTDSTSGLDCTSDEVILACPECAQACYRVIDCEGGFFEVLSDITAYGLDDISNYVGQFVTLIDNSVGTPITGTFFVDSLSPTCTNAVGNITVDPVLPAECDCRCFEIVGTFFNLTYVDCENNLITSKAGGSFKICSKTYPIVSILPGQDPVQIVEGSSCIDGECPIECFVLVNCETQQVLSTESELYPYFINNQTVTLNGYEGCWQVLSGDCLCIDVVVDGVTMIATFNGQIYNNEKVWELEVPQNSGGGAPLITYYIWADVFPGSWNITQEVSVSTVATRLAYISSGILDCPILASWGTGRWPDSTPVGIASSTKSATCTIGCDDCPTNVTVLEVYDDCPTCVGPTSYKLTNCDNSADIIYTTNDLSAYIDQIVELENCGCYIVEQLDIVPPTDIDVTVLFNWTTCEECSSTYYKLTECTDGSIIYTTDDLSTYIGSIIKFEGCDDKCWSIEETRIPEVLSTIVVSETYSTCPECTTDLPCVCSKITNVSDTPVLISYLNCDDATVEVLVQPGETLGKDCIKKWNIPTVTEGDPPIWYPEYFGNCTDGVCPPENLVTSQNRKIKPGYNTPICSADKYDKITCEFADIYYKKALEGRYGISNCCPEKLQNWTLKKNLIDMQALKDPYFNCAPQTSCNCGNTSLCTTCNSQN